MAFSDFTYPEVLTTLGLTYQAAQDLFAGVAEIPPDPVFLEKYPIGTRLASMLNNEKARSEWMIAPLLSEFWWRYRGQVGLYSGVEFDGDPGAGLCGFCDFILARAPQQTFVSSPVVVIFEAKRDNIIDGLGQCVAGMVGAQRFNRRHNTPIDPLYGAVTTGSAWKFLRLADSILTVDLLEYTGQQVGKLFGIFAHVIGPVAVPAAA